MSARVRLGGLILLLLPAGCADRSPPPLAVVRGQVTFRGAPLPGGLVVFTPDEDFGGHGPQAEGVIGYDGRFTLTTSGASGAGVGRHRVTVVGPSGWPLPVRFLDPGRSGLQAEVLAGQDNFVELKLEER
jgi:hypothetical protein